MNEQDGQRIAAAIERIATVFELLLASLNKAIAADEARERVIAAAEDARQQATE